MKIAAEDFRLEQEEIDELEDTFESLKLENQISVADLQKALEIVNVKLPQYEIRNIISEKYKDIKSLSIDEFTKLCFDLKSKLNPNFRLIIHKASNIKVLEGASEASQAIGIIHSVKNEEQVAFADWINSNLRNDSDLESILPLQISGDDLYEKITDGRVLCKLINSAVPDTIDERAINKKKLSAYTKLENLILVVNSARAIGCNIVNIDADDLAKAKKHLVLGLLWQIIRVGLFNQIDLVHVPGLIRLLNDDETLADLQKLAPETILIRWVNYHLKQAGIEKKIDNFTSDIQDSIAYIHLLKQIAPDNCQISLDALNLSDSFKRAEKMLCESEKLKCRSFLRPQDVVNGVYKLNLAFVANLFNTWPNLKPPEEPEKIAELEAIQEETREEKTYRNWMNSLAVEPHVNWLYSDLSNGLVILQLFDKIKTNTVDWKQASTKFERFRSMMQQIENCNYAIDIGRQLRFSLVGIQGKDIYDGNSTLTLALLWQLMRAYTLTILANCRKHTSCESMISDKEIIDWANAKLMENNKGLTLSSFQDQELKDGKLIIHLIDCIQPDVIDFALVYDGNDNTEKLANAKYAISTARKIGAIVYALPEDVVELKPKMIMTVFACLMARDLNKTKNGSTVMLNCSQETNNESNCPPTVPLHRQSTSATKMKMPADSPIATVVQSSTKPVPPIPPQRSGYRIPKEKLQMINGSLSLKQSDDDDDADANNNGSIATNGLVPSNELKQLVDVQPAAAAAAATLDANGYESKMNNSTCKVPSSVDQKKTQTLADDYVDRDDAEWE